MEAHAAKSEAHAAKLEDLAARSLAHARRSLACGAREPGRVCDERLPGGHTRRPTVAAAIK